MLPKVTSFTPSSGPVGTLVTVKGSGFGGVSDVQFNGVSTGALTSVSATRVKATVPVGAATGPITVMTPAGSATSAAAFTVGAGSSFRLFSALARLVGLAPPAWAV